MAIRMEGLPSGLCPPPQPWGANTATLANSSWIWGWKRPLWGLQWVPDPGGWWAAGSVCQTLLLLWGRQLPARARCCGDYADPLQLPRCAEGFLSL